MTVRSIMNLTLLAGCLAPTMAAADGLVIPGFGPDPSVPRPGYRQAVFPPPQTNFLGLPEPAPLPSDRPSYREAYTQFPPPGGRYGGGLLEYVLTGGRPEPVAYPVYSAPGYVAPSYAGASTSSGGLFGALASDAQPASAATVNPMRASLPHGGLPDYRPEPSADGTATGYAGQPGYAQPSYGQAAYAQPGGFAGSAEAFAADPGPVSRPMNPDFNRQVVAYSGRERAGTIIIDTPDKFLYLVQGNGQAIRYGIGVGRPGFAWAGVKSVSRKAEWPAWTPPPQMLKRRPDLPRHMVGGEANPLGARALYLGSSMYRIHGTNEPDTIGTNVSSGCIRMMNQDVIDLYGRVGVGARVVVL